jgi:hypothetical protein
VEVEGPGAGGRVRAVHMRERPPHEGARQVCAVCLVHYRMPRVRPSPTQSRRTVLRWSA